MAAAPKGVSEILLHPGLFEPGESLPEWHKQHWPEEAHASRDPEVLAHIAEYRIELISYREL
jgi:hypothetical protein